MKIHRFLILISFLFTQLAYAREFKPLPTSAYEKYPFNTVGTVTVDGQLGSGCAIGNRLVMANASIFYQSFLGVWRDEPYNWQWKRDPRNQSEDGVTARSWVAFEDYASIVNSEERGEDANAAFNKCLFLLQFSEDIIDSAPAVIAVDQLGEENYKMIVGYVRQIYEYYQLERNRMHATGRAEPQLIDYYVYPESESETVPYRFMKTRGLKTSYGNHGSPVFAFLENGWKVVGMDVASNLSEGAAFAMAIDSVVNDMITAASTEETPAEPSQGAAQVYDHSQDDVNLAPSDGEFMGDLRSHSASVFPAGDVDYFQFFSTDSGSHSIQVVADDIPLRVEIFENETDLLYSSTIDSSTRLTITYNVALDLYLRISAVNPEDTGEYKVELFNTQLDPATLVDAAQSDYSPIPIAINQAYKATLRLPLSTDYYQFEITELSKVLINSSAALDLDGAIFTINDGATFPISGDEANYIDVDADSSRYLNFLIEETLEPGTYYLQVFSRDFSGTGVYNFQIVATPDLLGTPGGDSEDNDSFRNANNTFFNRTYFHSFYKGGDIDFRRIFMTDPGLLTIETTGESDTFGVLYNSNYNALVSDDNTGNNNNFRINHFVERGEYFVKIQNVSAEATGNYEVLFTQEPMPDFWQGFTGLPFGEKTLPWFGTFTSDSTTIGWITHEQLGEVYITGVSVEDFDIWIPSTGLWFNTSSTAYPILTTKAGGVQYRHVAGTTDPMQFERVSDVVIFNADELIPESFN